MRFHRSIWTYPNCGNYARQTGAINELVALADEKGASFWKAMGMLAQGCSIGPDRQGREAVPDDHLRDDRIAVNGSNTVFALVHCHPWREPIAELGQFDDAWRCIGEAMTAVETTKESWCEAEVYRIAGEIALMSPEPDAAKAQKRISSARSRSRVNSKQSPGNSAPQ